jgi:hypothetical protein
VVAIAIAYAELKQMDDARRCIGEAMTAMVANKGKMVRGRGLSDGWRHDPKYGFTRSKVFEAQPYFYRSALVLDEIRKQTSYPLAQYRRCAPKEVFHNFWI